MQKPINYQLVLSVLLVPVIIYLYFLHWRTGVIYGDDLYIFKTHEELNSFSEKIGMPISFGKYRPLHGLSMHYLIELFQKNLRAYYVFNVAVQALNTFLFAALLNLFLKSRSLSVVFSLIIGLSRFSFFNVTQLMNGGALEGMAMTFFLVSLYFLLSGIARQGYTTVQIYRAIVSSILFANFAMYTHERYIVMLPFIILMVLLNPSLKVLTKNQKLVFLAMALGSIMLNVFIKKSVYHMPFFMGTASTTISFSFSTVFTFLIDGVLSILQVNSGPEYLVGMRFTGLSFFEKSLVIILLFTIISIFAACLMRFRKKAALKEPGSLDQFWLLVFLGMLFFAFLLPAIITIRLEQRWLQASFSIFILMLVIAFSSLSFKSLYNRNWCLSLLLILLLWTDFNYLAKGGGNLYMTYSERLVTTFEDGINKGIIRPGTKNLYIWEKQRDANSERTINWDLATGYFFNFYQANAKKIYFADSVYQRDYTFPFNSIVHFDTATDQVVYVDNQITDITSEYLRDSVRNFSNRLKAMTPGGSLSSIQQSLNITATDFDKVSTTGFYDLENGLRWTNGSSTISLAGDFLVKDSVTVLLDTYLPPVCRDINPTLILQTIGKPDYLPASSVRVGDQFIFRFYFPSVANIQRISIAAPAIAPAPPDQRVLSFPFVSVKILRK